MTTAPTTSPIWTQDKEQINRLLWALKVLLDTLVGTEPLKQIRWTLDNALEGILDPANPLPADDRELYQRQYEYWPLLFDIYETAEDARLDLLSRANAAIDQKLVDQAQAPDDSEDINEYESSGQPDPVTLRNTPDPKTGLPETQWDARQASIWANLLKAGNIEASVLLVEMGLTNPTQVGDLTKQEVRAKVLSAAEKAKQRGKIVSGNPEDKPRQPQQRSKPPTRSREPAPTTHDPAKGQGLAIISNVTDLEIAADIEHRIEALQGHNALLIKIRDRLMIEGVHYGAFRDSRGNKTKRYGLRLVGAQVLCRAFGLVPDKEASGVVDQVVDVANGYYYARVRVALSLPNGAVVGVSEASCNSLEPNFSNEQNAKLLNKVQNMAFSRAYNRAAIQATMSGHLWSNE